MVGGRVLLLDGDLYARLFGSEGKAGDVEVTLGHTLEVGNYLPTLANFRAESGEGLEVFVVNPGIAEAHERFDPVGLFRARARNKGLERIVPARELGLCNARLDVLAQGPRFGEGVGTVDADVDDADSIGVKGQSQLGLMVGLSVGVATSGQDAGLDGDKLVHKFEPFVIGPDLNKAIRLDSDGSCAQGPRALGDIARRG